jgi:chemotaxis family two-component system sensor kinase Cph1
MTQRQDPGKRRRLHPKAVVTALVGVCAAIVIFRLSSPAASHASTGATEVPDPAPACESCAPTVGIVRAGLVEGNGAAEAAGGGARWLFDTSGFPRRWECGTWSEGLGWTHIASDVAIWSAYMAIPVVLGYFAVRGRTPVPTVTWLFVAFIASCGIGHLIEAAIFWTPVYRLAGAWKAVTAVVSWATVVALIPVTRRAITWPTLAQMNERLRAEVAARAETEVRLREANDRLEAATREAEQANHTLRENEHALAGMNRELMFQRRALDEHAIVAATDARGRITDVNAMFCRISGYSKEELIGQDHRMINSGHHPRTFFTEMYRTIASGGVWRGVIRNRAKDGSIYWVQTTIVPRMGDDGRILGYLAIRDDVTPLKQFEEQLRSLNKELSSRNAEMEQFVYTASHDLKSPLVTVLGYTTLLERDARAGKIDELAGFAERIARAARHMKANVDDLLELSRVGRVSNEPGWISLPAAAAECISQLDALISEAGAEVECRFECPRVFADRTMFVKVMTNLLTNAVKYGCGGKSRRIEVGSVDGDGEARLYVRDFGQGIPPEHLERVFGLFQRLSTDREGTGVGLAIVRRVAEVHGGRAWAESTPGAGATFWVSFPVHAPVPAAETARTR